jgi:hypothetical protein
LVVRAGDELTGIDLTLTATSTVRLSGLISEVGAAVASLADIFLTRIGNTSADIPEDLTHATTKSDRTGHFALYGVPRGDYELRILSYPKTGPNKGPFLSTTEDGLPVISGVVPGIKAASERDPVLETKRNISVYDSDVPRVNLIAERASSLRGLIVFGDGSSGASAEVLSNVSVTLQPVRKFGSILAASAQVDSAGSFTFASLPAGRYSLSVHGAIGWYVRSIELNGHAVTGDLVDVDCCEAQQSVITLIDRPASISGTATGAAEWYDDSFVFLFPTDSTLWRSARAAPNARFKQALTSRAGAFALSGLLPGDYIVISVSNGLLDFDWREPEMLSLLSAHGTRVSVKQGQHLQISIRALRLN